MLKRFWLKAGLFLAACSAIGAIAGCGGGGGSTAPVNQGALRQCSVTTAAGTVIYNTIWGATAANGSQVIQIVNAAGTVIRTDSISDRNGQATSQLVLNAVPAGVHLIRATLYAGPNASGTVQGVATAVVDLCRSAPAAATDTITTQAGVTPAALHLTPSTAELIEQEQIQFVATATIGSNVAFLPANGLNWTVTGPIGTVTSVGNFTATTAGSGAVIATVNATGLTASSQVSVNPRNVTQAKWTVLVYMNAANDLYSYSRLNMNQMESVAQNPDVRFVVQWKQSQSVFGGSSFDGVRRYLVKPDTTDAIVSELVQNNLQDENGNALDMGNPETLADFIKWGKQNYPADRYCLVLWNHGNGWKRSAIDDMPTRAFSYDDQYGTSIKTWQTDEMMDGESVDIIAWDASLMQMLEVAYEARPYADYIVGSEESPPGEGYPYHLVFDNFRDNPDLGTETLASSFVEGMQEQSQPGNLYQFRKITQSVIRTNQLDTVATRLSEFGDSLLGAKLSLGTAVPQIRTAAQSYSPTTTRYYRDIGDLCDLFVADPSGDVPQTVKDAALNLRQALADAIAAEFHNSQSPKSNGLAIDFSPLDAFTTYRSDYIQLKLAQDTSWDEWLSEAP